VKRIVGSEYSEPDIRPWGGSMPLRSSTWRRRRVFASLGVATVLLAPLGRARATDGIREWRASAVSTLRFQAHTRPRLQRVLRECESALPTDPIEPWNEHINQQQGQHDDCGADQQRPHGRRTERVHRIKPPARDAALSCWPSMAAVRVKRGGTVAAEHTR
jgi:hypothetical protein